MPFRGVVPVLLVLVLVAGAVPAEANWLSRLVQEAGEAGGKAARRGAGSLEDAAAHLRSLPATGPNGAALAASVSQEGHWTFVNRAGERFTAGTPDELKRVATVLAPETSGSRLSLLVTEDAVFGQRAHLNALPDGAVLRLSVGSDSYPILGGKGKGTPLYAEVRPNVLVAMQDQAAFREALWQLARSVAKARVRVIALDPDGPQTLPTMPKIDPTTRMAMPDRIDPYKLADAMRAIRGQTVILIGRSDGKLLHFRPSSGPERSLIIDDVTHAAARADVNLVVLQSPTPRQPGARTWLWQKYQVSRMEEALRAARLRDFLDALAGDRGPLVATVQTSGGGRTSLSVRALDAGEPRPTGDGGGILSDIISGVSGNVAISAVEMNLSSSERQRELDARIAPGIPSDIQFLYIGLVVIGLMGIGPAARWWCRVWPPERRDEYRNAFGHGAAKAARLAAFLLIFVPLIAIASVPTALMQQAIAVLTWPVRMLRSSRVRRAAESV